MTALPSIKGWCPTALRPMETGDGFLVRLRFTGGNVTAQHCTVIATLARTYGNGLIDLSQRGNLQLRGVKVDTLPALTAALFETGLIDENTDSIPNVIASQLAGLDPASCIDGASFAREFESRLVSAGLHHLPEKFCFLVDDGGRFGLDNVAADIRLIGIEHGVALAIASGEGNTAPIALMNIDDARDAAIALARAFLKLREGTSARRMGQLVQSIGIEAIAHQAGLKHNTPLSSLPYRITEMQDVIGIHKSFTGVAAPFGRLTADQMDQLALLAPGGLRLTPWRCVLVPNASEQTLSAFEDAGFIISAEDPRLAIVACTGAPACASAQIDTRLAAEALALLARTRAAKGIALHISGCSKGCAHAAAAPVTLVGRNGAYDLVLNGCAGDTPALYDLSLPQALDAVCLEMSLS